MSIYISGPMFGYEGKNKVAFSNAVEFLRKKYPNAILINPHDIIPGIPESVFNEYTHEVQQQEYLKADLRRMLKLDVNSLYMLKGWRESFGASLEHKVASACGI